MDGIGKYSGGGTKRTWFRVSLEVRHQAKTFRFLVNTRTDDAKAGMGKNERENLWKEERER